MMMFHSFLYDYQREDAWESGKSPSALFRLMNDSMDWFVGEKLQSP
jgi:hypothetical protein